MCMSVNEYPLETYEIGFFIVFDEYEEIIGKLVVSGFLHSLHAEFVPWLRNFKVDATCSIIRVCALFDLEMDDWFGHINSAASNMLIREVIPLPVFVAQDKPIGYITVVGTCSRPAVVFSPLSKIIQSKMTRIFVEDKILDKPRAARLIAI